MQLALVNQSLKIIVFFKFEQVLIELEEGLRLFQDPQTLQDQLQSYFMY
jgi:hypothetical protein